MDLTEEIAKMNFYKTFEPYIDPSVTMEQRMRGDIRLRGEIWWLIDLFRISDMVDETNEEILGTCIEEAKALYP